MSDGRYGMYHPQQVNSSYDYSNYPQHAPPPPPPSYESPPISQPPPRPMRQSSSSQPHSPPQQPQYAPPPPSSYPPTYVSGPYMSQPPPPPPPQPQWTSEGWVYPQQSYPPPPPPPPAAEVPYTSGTGRPESVPSSSSEPRSYTAPPINSEARRVDDRPQPLPNPPAPPKARRREKEPSPAATSPGTPTGLDFMKLLDSYRSIIDGSEALSHNSGVAPGRSPPVETLERMIQSAMYGVQLLESATIQQPTPVSEVRSPKEKEPEEAKESPTDNGPSSKRQKTDDTVQEGQTCLGCSATSTPEWRRGPMGPRTLCNACGLVYAKLIKKRVREGGRASGKTNGQGGGSTSHGNDDGFASEGDSDDDDEYGSQDRRSDMGDGGRD